ncbi:MULTISPECIES: HipA N-terminal domain-containing protein [unclassified Erwinia]|nr:MULTISPECIES: HipA N-terminal domain-containing protein [unclassified Erwinia]
MAPEGWLKGRYCQLQKIDEHDILGLLANNGINMPGAVQISAASSV